jgi:hypothetical protein
VKRQPQCRFLNKSTYEGKPMLFRCMLEPGHDGSHWNSELEPGEGLWRAATEEERAMLNNAGVII